MKSLPGPVFEASQINSPRLSIPPPIDPKSKKDKKDKNQTKVEQPVTSEPPKLPLTFVFFLGGVTAGEISSLRFFSKQQGKGSGCEFLIGTTKVITGDNIMESVIERVNP